MGVLKLRKNSYTARATAISIAMDEVIGNREDFEYRFSAIADCSTLNCRESYCISGSSRWHYETHPCDPHGDRWEVLKVKAVFPALGIIDYPKQTPESVKYHIDRACVLFWTDQRACLSALRITMEAICHAKGIPKEQKTKNGKTVKTSLHAQLKMLKPMTQEDTDALIAAKWLGNSGSHLNETPDVDDTINAFKLIEFALHRLYDEKRDEIRRITTKVNQQKGY